ncbi:MAG: ATP-binding protein, partial [Anaerovoracaceae bacterium]
KGRKEMKYEESETIELKQQINADFKKEIVAFANSDGGKIYVGITPEGEPIGVLNREKTMEQIGNMIRDGIKPDLSSYTSIKAVDENGAKCVIVTVQRGGKRPYHLSDKGLKPTGVYVRHGISSVPATDEAIRNMIRESDGVTFDKSRCILQELTFEYAEKIFLQNKVSFSESNKQTLGLIDLDGYYTNAAQILSDQCEHSIKCAVYEGTGKMKFKARKAFFGSILKQMNDAFEYIGMSNNLNSTFDKLERIDNYDYPPYAIREALVNTVVHRDYDYSGSTLINIFDDRIEFVSIGGLVKGLTMSDIMNGISQSRNMIIADIFYRLKLIESYGTGIQRIIESYETSNRKPKFQSATASFVVTLPKIVERSLLTLDGEITNIDMARQLIKEKGEISRKELENKLLCSKFTALNILKELLYNGEIIKNNAGVNTKYKLK